MSMRKRKHRNTHAHKQIRKRVRIQILLRLRMRVRMRTWMQLHVQAWFVPGPAADYIQMCASRAKWPARADGQVARLVEDEFLRAADVEVESVVVVEGEGQRCAACRARN